MAARKKTGRRKAARRKAAPRRARKKKPARTGARKKRAAGRKKKPAKKPARPKAAPRKVARRAAPRPTPARKPAARTTPRAPAPARPASAAPGSVAAGVPERVGRVTHWFGHANAAIVAIEEGSVRVGDTLHFRGHTTDFYQRIDRMEVDHQPIEHAGPGQEIGIQVTQRTREHDEVFRVSK